MNLIDKYIAEVGKHLPRRNRSDIEAEIRSTLEDMLDERKQTDGPADDATVLALLKEYGSPRQVAATYKTHQYLIGPRLFSTFEMVLRIVFAVVFGVSLLGLVIALMRSDLTGPAFVIAMTEWIGGLITALIAAFGNIVIVFAIIERTQAVESIEKEFSDWDPKELQSEPSPDQIDRADHIASIVFTVIALAIFNLYPDVLAIRYQSDGAWVSLPVLTDAFFRFLPWINVMALIQIAFSGFMLGQRDWIPVTRSFGILVDIASMVLAVAILRTPGILGITPQTLSAIGNAEAAEALSRVINFVPLLIITIVVVATVIKVGKSAFRLLSGRSKSPYPIVR
jgi:hypothetical protein